MANAQLKGVATQLPTRFNMAENILGIQIASAIEDGIADLKQAVASNPNVAYTESNDLEGIEVYPINSDLVNILADYAGDLGVDDTSVRIILVSQDGQVIINQDINSAYANTINSPASWFSLTQVSDIRDYLETGIANGTFTGAVLTLPVEPDEEQADEEASDAVADDSFADDTVDEFADDTADEFADDTVDETAVAEPEQPINADSEQPLVDPINETVRQVVANSELPEIPVLNAEVNGRMQAEYMQAQTKVEQARQRMLQAMQDKYDEAYQSGVKVAQETKLDEAQSAHDETLSRIDDNLDADVSALQDERDQQYADEKEAFIEREIARIREQYDVDHKDEFEAQTKQQVAELTANADDLHAEENDNFDRYVAETLADYGKEVANSVDYSTELDAYRAVVDETTKVLYDRADALSDEDTADIRQAREQLAEAQRQLSEAKSTITVLQDTQDATISAEVTRQVSDAMVESNQKLAEAQNQYQEEHDALLAERRKSMALVREGDSLRTQLSNALSQAPANMGANQSL